MSQKSIFHHHKKFRFAAIGLTLIWAAFSAAVTLTVSSQKTEVLSKAYLPIEAQKKPTAIVILGDSNADINSVTSVEKWSQKLAKNYPDLTVVNLAIGGKTITDFTTPQIKRKIESAANKIPTNAQVHLIISLGTNNAINKNQQLSEEEFIKTFQDVLSFANEKFRPSKVYVVTLPPAWVKQTNSSTKNPTFNVDSESASYVQQYNSALSLLVDLRTAEQKPYLQLVRMFPNTEYQPESASKLLLPDGIHLNAAAQEKVFAKIQDALFPKE